MKTPLRYQITEFDCGSISLLNCITYLFKREEIPAKLVKAITNTNVLWDQSLKENVCCLIENSCDSIETNFIPPIVTQIELSVWVLFYKKTEQDKVALFFIKLTY